MEAVQNPHAVVVEVTDDSNGGCRVKEHTGGGVGGGAGGVGARRCCGSKFGTRSDGGEEKEEAEDDGCVVAEIVEERRSSASERSIEVDVELGIQEILHSSKSARDCRICHMSLDAANQESGVPIELGCCCKDDLAAAHKQCAETWFKIKGNKICEVCGSIACNVSGANKAESLEHWNEATETTQAASAPTHVAEARNFWQGHRFLNILLSCMIFAFVISWLIHFNVPS